MHCVAAYPFVDAPHSLALGGLGVVVALVVLQHLLWGRRPAPADHFDSEYARGTSGWAQVVAFLAWGVSIAATAVLAGRHRGRPVARTLVLLGLAVGAIGAVACACFATVTVGGELPVGAPCTTAGRPARPRLHRDLPRLDPCRRGERPARPPGGHRLSPESASPPCSSSSTRG